MAGTADTKANSNRRKQKSIISQWQPLRDSAWDKAHGLRFVRRTHREASGIVRYGTGKELQMMRNAVVLPALPHALPATALTGIPSSPTPVSAALTP
jgi:hypothetical protein